MLVLSVIPLIARERLLDTSTHTFAHFDRWFLQDNDPKHKSTLVRTWLFNNGIQCINFPPYSPDLNPIENLWADLARRVEQFQCDTMEELQDIAPRCCGGCYVMLLLPDKGHCSLVRVLRRSQFSPLARLLRFSSLLLARSLARLASFVLDSMCFQSIIVNTKSWQRNG